MGANGSYSKFLNRVPSERRSHTDSHHHIDGHKILLQSKSQGQTKNIMFSNSENPIYLIGKRNSQGEITVESLNIYEGHKLVSEINLKYDSQGNVKPYNPDPKHQESGSHAHTWIDGDKPGYRQRKVGNNGRSEHLPIPDKYIPLIEKIVKFNKQRNK